MEGWGPGKSIGAGGGRGKKVVREKRHRYFLWGSTPRTSRGASGRAMRPSKDMKKDEIRRGIGLEGLRKTLMIIVNRLPPIRLRSWMSSEVLCLEYKGAPSGADGIMCHIVDPKLRETSVQ